MRLDERIVELLVWTLQWAKAPEKESCMEGKGGPGPAYFDDKTVIFFLRSMESLSLHLASKIFIGLAGKGGESVTVSAYLVSHVGHNSTGGHFDIILREDVDIALVGYVGGFLSRLLQYGGVLKKNV